MKVILLVQVLLSLCSLTSSYTVFTVSSGMHVADAVNFSSDIHPGDSLIQLRDSLIDYARTYIGTPYEYGAHGPDQFDCSGYTSHVFKYVSKELPFSSRSQIHMGEKVSLDSASRGDLIFFTSPRSGELPGHVGIVSRNDADGLFFIHSSTQRGVVEDKLTGYYRRRFISIRQIFD